MTLAGRDEVWIDGELIAVDADCAVDDRLTARVIGEAKCDARFNCHEVSFHYFNLRIPNYKFQNGPTAF
jgi:hypothetical protein